MTFERIAARWYSMRAFTMYMVGCPDDPKVIRLRQSFDRLRGEIEGINGCFRVV